MEFLNNKQYVLNDFIDYAVEIPKFLCGFVESKLSEKWDLNLDITIPFLVLPENGSKRK